MHCNDTTRKIAKGYSRFSKCFAILQNFSSVYELHIINRLRYDCFVCTYKASIRNSDKVEQKIQV